MKSLVILGSTGSIGTSTLKIVEAFPAAFRIAGLAARSHADALLEQAIRFKVPIIALEQRNPTPAFQARAQAHQIQVVYGPDAIAALAALPEADLVVCAMVGLSGLKPVLSAMHAGHDVALATKEVLVSAGELVMRERMTSNVRMLPVDSEHSAIFQCLQSSIAQAACVRTTSTHGTAAEDDIQRLVLTASGGPFARHPDIDLTTVTPQQALNHPKWNMGPKVTIDSATMMNKGFEIMEARWLFNVPLSKIDIVVHPESIVHSLVTYRDGASVAQLSQPDMRFAIQYALTYPQRLAATMPTLDLAQQGALSFFAPDPKRFPCLTLIRQADDAGGTMPAVVNAADEIAVAAFIAGKLDFPKIWQIIETVMACHAVQPCTSFDAVFAADRWARCRAEEEIQKCMR